MTYPQLKGGIAHVLVLRNGCDEWSKAMFYMNGGKPVFASYGFNVTDEVKKWRYREPDRNDAP
ncbi:MAG: hypothetical protein J6N15_09495 [Ruminiclostridium sp.]|nr:hypothetical protein [Ruminiclostridium sp.]